MAVAAWLTAVVLVGGGAVLAATMFRIDLGLTPVAAAVPAALIAGGIFVAARLRRLGPTGTTRALMATLLVVYAVVVVEGFPVLERSRPTAPVGRWIDRHAPPDAPIGVYGLDDWRGSIRFYTKRRIVVLHDGGEVTRFFNEHPDSYTLMLRSDANGFQANGVPLRRVGGRRMIVGRSGKFIRRQLWGRLVVTELASPAARLSTEPDTDLPDR